MPKKKEEGERTTNKEHLERFYRKTSACYVRTPIEENFRNIFLDIIQHLIDKETRE